MGRIVAAIWAAIAFFSAVSTIGNLRPPGADIEQMRAIAVAAVVLSGACFLVPWQRVPRAIFNVPLILMTVSIGVLAYAEGSVRTDLTLLFTFVIMFAAYFLSWQASAAQLVLIAAVLAVRLFMLDTSDATRDEAPRLAVTLPALALFAALVALLRARVRERERKLAEREAYDYQTGLLSRDEAGGRCLRRRAPRSDRHDDRAFDPRPYPR
jgi:hypothetical protein